MIEKTDQFLIKLAGKIIIVAAFFGIDRRIAMNLWIIIGVLAFRVHDSIAHKDSIVLLLVFRITVLVLCLFHANSEYREDEVLANAFTKELRLFLVGPGVATSIVFAITKPVFYLNIIEPFFYLYFLLNQTPKNPLRLRDLVRNLFRVQATAPQMSPVTIDS